MPTLARSMLAAIVVAAALLLTSGVAGAASGQVGGGTDEQFSKPAKNIAVLVGGPVFIAEGQTVDSIFMGRGDVIVDGKVDGPVIVVNGTAVIRGTVTQAVVVMRGRVVVADGGHVEGDVLSSRPPRIAAGATVDGKVQRVRFTEILNAFGVAVRVYWWIAISISTLVAGLVLSGAFGGLARRTVDAGRTEVPACIATGVIASIGVPLVCGLLLLTLLATPLGLTGLMGMAPLYLLGYVTGALFLGHLILRERSGLIASFLLGWVILRLVGILPFLGGLLTLAPTVYGLGILLVAIWQLTRPTPEVTPAPGEPEPDVADGAEPDDPTAEAGDDTDEGTGAPADEVADNVDADEGTEAPADVS